MGRYHYLVRVLIDATSVLLRSAGIKSYTYHWIEHLRAIAGDDEILAFPYLNGLGRLDHERSVLTPAATYARLGMLYFVNVPGNRAIDWIASGADVFHVSNQVRNPPRKVPLTATIHDLTCWLMPQLHTAANVRADQSFASQVLKRSRRLIAVSENSREDAIRILDIDPERIDVIYSGVSDAYFTAQATAAAKPYVLFVGTIEPRKNVDTLLDAWHMVRPDVRDAFDLVIIGATGWGSAATLARLNASAESVRYRGYVDERELPGVTAGASAFVYPSLYEGFGFPVAQAMACGVPVITSNNSCLPEIAGPGALLIDPRSPVQIASALDQLLTSPSLAAHIGSEGRRRAENYRWTACAQRSLDFFRKAAG
jgi:glycosyltransferase involved in cell wall biosynthesis